MLSLTRKTDYALVALARLAEPKVSEDDPVSARQIADEYHLPTQVLVKVLKDLQRAGIIGSTRGAHGGYFLSRLADAINIAEITEAIEGPARLAPCCGDEAKPCETCIAEPVCPIADRVQRLNEAIQQLLGSITLEQLLADELPPILKQLIGDEQPESGEMRHAGRLRSIV